MQRTFPSLCRGIGHGLVKKLLERSNKVIATARVPQDAQQLQQLAAENSNLIVAALDVSQPDSITQFAAEVKTHTQHVDVSESVATGGSVHGPVSVWLYRIMPQLQSLRGEPFFKRSASSRRRAKVTGRLVAAGGMHPPGTLQKAS